jgi:glycerol-3-phosphate responsive antiterminator
LAPEAPRPTLPRVLIADGGGRPVRRPAGLPWGVLLRDIDLTAVVERAANREGELAIDLDSVRGMAADTSAADFVIDTLDIRIVLTRRPQVAAHVAGRGGVGLIHALAVDSTGVRRSLAAAPMLPFIGTVVSPAVVLRHMRPSELAALRRPIVGYGLLTDVRDARDCLDVANAVVVRQDLADALAASLATRPETLTPIGVGE